MKILYIALYNFLLFQLPVIVGLLVALLIRTELKMFYLPVLVMVLGVIPLVLVLTNKDYSDYELFELKQNIKNYQ